MNSTKTWLVTGANGFLGMNAGVFLSGKAQTIGATRQPHSSPIFDNHVQFDIQDLSSVRSTFSSLKPDVVLNTAALASHQLCEENPELALEVNAIGAKNVAIAAEEIGAQLLHISTDAVFDGKSGNYREDDATSPFSVYGQTKLAGERAVLTELPTALVVRTNFFGWSPTGERSILEFFVNSLTQGKRVDGYSNYFVSSIYAQDLLQALFELSDFQHSGLLHVVSSDSLSKYDFGVAVARQWELDSQLIQASHDIHHEGTNSLTRDLSLNTDKAMELLGRRFPTQLEGIQRAKMDLPVVRSKIVRAESTNDREKHD